MEYSEAKQVTEDICMALKTKKYVVKYDEPNNIFECTAPDGRTFYKLVDMDDVRSSNDFGACHVCVNTPEGDYNFSCDLGTGEYESDFFDELEDEYELADGPVVTRESIEEKVLDALYSCKDICFGECIDFDGQVDLWLPDDAECYCSWEDDCPVDIDDCDFTYPKDLDYGTVYFEEREYYLVEKHTHQDGEQLHAVDSNSEAFDDGTFETVLLTMKYLESGEMVVTKCDECYDMYNGVECNIV